MVAWHEITCVTLNPNQSDPQQRITHIGGHDAKGRLWRLTLDEAIQGIHAGKWSFCIINGSKRIAINVAVGKKGFRFLKSETDDGDPTMLLSLPECKL